MTEPYLTLEMTLVVFGAPRRGMQNIMSIGERITPEVFSFAMLWPVCLGAKHESLFSDIPEE